MPAASAARPDPRALAERVSALARRLAERNRVLSEEVADLRAYIDRLHQQPDDAAPAAESTHPPSATSLEPVGESASAPPPPPERDRESEKLLELVRIALDRTLQEVDDHLDRLNGRDQVTPEDLDAELADHAQ